MDLLSIILVAVSLSMDSFSVSLAAGLCKYECKTGRKLLFPLFLALFQAGFFSAGWYLGSQFLDLISAFDHWIAFGLLLFIGGRMIVGGIKTDSDSKPFNHYAFINMISLAIGTSIDALAVGIAFALSEDGLGLMALIIGITTALFSISGIVIGRFLGKKIHFPFDIVGGIILVLIGVKILYTHLH